MLRMSVQDCYYNVLAVTYLIFGYPADLKYQKSQKRHTLFIRCHLNMSTKKCLHELNDEVLKLKNFIVAIFLVV